MQGSPSKLPAADQVRPVYCTIFDHRYLPRGLALIESMRRHGAQEDIFVLCTSDPCFEAMTSLALPGVRLVNLHEIEPAFQGLKEARQNRLPIEFYYTCTPAIAEYALEKSPEANTTVYLDADLWFFASPKLVFDEIGDAPVAIIPHNFANHPERRKRHGIYNVGWVSFSRSEEGLHCLRWWRENCINWCYGRVEGELFADQGYLNQFGTIAPHTKVLWHKGLNTAPWNIGNYQVTLRDGRVFLDDDPLVFFHFHGVDRLGVFYFDNHRHYGAPHNKIIRNAIYRPYIAELLSKEAIARKALPEAGVGRVKLGGGSSVLGIDIKNLRRQTLRKLNMMMDIVAARPIVVLNERAH